MHVVSGKIYKSHVALTYSLKLAYELIVIEISKIYSQLMRDIISLIKFITALELDMLFYLLFIGYIFGIMIIQPFLHHVRGIQTLISCVQYKDIYRISGN